MDDNTKVIYTVNGKDYEDEREAAEAMAKSLRPRTRVTQNSDLLENFRLSIVNLQLAESAVVEAYQEMVSQWSGDGNVPLKSARESINLFQHLGKVEKGLEGLREILEDALQLKMF